MYHARCAALLIEHDAPMCEEDVAGVEDAFRRSMRSAGRTDVCIACLHADMAYTVLETLRSVLIDPPLHGIDEYAREFATKTPLVAPYSIHATTSSGGAAEERRTAFSCKHEKAKELRTESRAIASAFDIGLRRLENRDVFDAIVNNSVLDRTFLLGIYRHPTLVAEAQHTFRSMCASVASSHVHSEPLSVELVTSWVTTSYVPFTADDATDDGVDDMRYACVAKYPSAAAHPSLDDNAMYFIRADQHYVPLATEQEFLRAMHHDNLRRQDGDGDGDAQKQSTASTVSHVVRSMCALGAALTTLYERAAAACSQANERVTVEHLESVDGAREALYDSMPDELAREHYRRNTSLRAYFYLLPPPCIALRVLRASLAVAEQMRCAARVAHRVAQHAYYTACTALEARAPRNETRREHNRTLGRINAEVESLEKAYAKLAAVSAVPSARVPMYAATRGAYPLPAPAFDALTQCVHGKHTDAESRAHSLASRAARIASLAYDFAYATAVAGSAVFCAAFARMQPYAAFNAVAYYGVLARMLWTVRVPLPDFAQTSLHAEHELRQALVKGSTQETTLALAEWLVHAVCRENAVVAHTDTVHRLESQWCALNYAEHSTFHGSECNVPSRNRCTLLPRRHNGGNNNATAGVLVTRAAHERSTHAWGLEFTPVLTACLQGYEDELMLCINRDAGGGDDDEEEEESL